MNKSPNPTIELGRSTIRGSLAYMGVLMVSAIGASVALPQYDNDAQDRAGVPQITELELEMPRAVPRETLEPYKSTE